MKRILILALTLSATLAMAAEPPLGTWEWVETEESAGVFTTPADVGYTVQFEFNGDMTFVKYRDEVIFASGDFWVADIEFNGYVIPALTLNYGNGNPVTCAYDINNDGVFSMWWGYNPNDGLPSYPIERYAPRAVGIELGNWGSIKALYR